MTRNQIISYIIVSLLLIAGGYYLYTKNSQTKTTVNKSASVGGVTELFPEYADTSEAICTLSDGTEIMDPTRCEKLKTYKSQLLGLEFQVHESAEVIEEGNRIYVGGKEGQYVELISKYDLQTPMEKVVELNGPTSKNCRISDLPRKVYIDDQRGELFAFPNTYTTISVSVHETDFDRGIENKPLLCQSKYAGNNGMTLFVADSEHPTKIAFISIGQYSIPAGEKLDWYHTLRFTK